MADDNLPRLRETFEAAQVQHAALSAEVLRRLHDACRQLNRECDVLREEISRLKILFGDAAN